MALLQSGNIYYIKCGLKDCEDEVTISSLNDYYSWFMQQFSETLNITDPEYSTIKYAKDEYSDTVAYFLLPYINKNTNEKLILVFKKGSLTLGIAKFYNNLIHYINNTDFKNYFTCKVEDEEVESGKFQYLSHYCTLIIDTNFLNSHGFYTIGFASSDKKILESYIAPNFFVIDAINKFNNNHTDGIFYLNEDIFYGDNKYPDFNNNFQKVRFGNPSIIFFLADYPGGTGLYPQVFTADEGSFSIVKIHFGQWKTAKDIYLTKTTNSALANFCYYQNMIDEKDAWKKIVREDLYGNKRDFLLGLNSIDNSNIDLTSSNNWIPVIEAIKEPFALKFSSDEDFSLFVENPNWDGVIEYSKDKGKTWVGWNGKRLNGNAEQNIYLRGIGNTIITGHNSPLTNETYEAFYSWNFTGKYIYGNIETLLDYKTVQKGNHPLMGNYCYRALFYGCSSLRKAPELPAIELKDYCYTRMFMRCPSLLETPELPATTLATYCYGNMFFGCDSLTKSPKLPATTLAPFCYIGMFQFCKSFVKVPKLPALTMVESCYESMFFGCSILNEVPELPSTTLAKRCYDEMFVQCYALTKMPKLPATSLATECYRYMFLYCSKIKISTTTNQTYSNSYRIPMSGIGTNATNALLYMFYGTGGSFTGTPTINRTYYTSNEVI